MKRIEELEELVDDNTPETDPLYLELDMLVDMVEEYEDVHYPVGSPSLIETIQLRMYEMGLNQQKATSPSKAKPSGSPPSSDWSDTNHKAFFARTPDDVLPRNPVFCQNSPVLI